MPLNKADTRAQLIDPALTRAGWDLEDHAQQREAQRQAEHLFQMQLHQALEGEV